MTKLDEETLKELKKDDVKRLNFMLSILNEIKIPNDPFHTVITADIHNKTFDMGLSPFQTEKDLKMLVKMGRIRKNTSGDSYFITSNEHEDRKPSVSVFYIVKKLLEENDDVDIEADIEKIKERATDYGIDPDEVEKAIPFLMLLKHS